MNNPELPPVLQPKKSFTRSYEQYVENGGWCSSAFLTVCMAMVEFWSKRGVITKFGRAGLLSTLNGEPMAIATTGYTPPEDYGFGPITDRSHNYVYMLLPTGLPVCRVHYKEQQNLVKFFEELYADLLLAEPYTPEEREAMDKAIAAGNSTYG